MTVPETVDLGEPTHGGDAVDELGDDLDVAADANGMSQSALRDLLLEDDTAWVDGHGRVYFVEPEAESEPQAGPARGTDSELPTYDAAAPFALHSKPGSDHVIFLDFDGALVSGTAWNNSGVAATTHPAWTLDADAATFSTTELNAIASIWARVAEDYAPFDVDVTTQDPGAAAISRTSAGDLTYGTRVLISPSTNAQTTICPTGCGGVAYLDVFNSAGSDHDYYQPAWVFPQKLGNSTKSIAEAATHEAGHNFGLHHDATGSASYYSGHAMWAPIMGTGYGRPVVQWSQGGYPGASTTENDVAIIAAGGAPYRADEAGASVTGAAPISASTAYVTTRTDVDVWSVGTCAGAVTLAANPAATSPDLDIELTLLSAAGATVATANPVSATSTSDVATGLGASLSTTLSSGAYFLRVDGVGNGGATSGYDDYGSLGAYTLSTSGCGSAGGGGGSQPVAPGQPTGLVVSPASDGRSATFSWSAPLADGGSPVTGYVVQRSGAVEQTLGSAARNATFSGLTPGATYTFTVSAVNAMGTGGSAGTSQAMPVPAAPPSVPRNLAVAVHEELGEAVVVWDPPTSNGGRSVEGYLVTVDGVQVADVEDGTTIRLDGLGAGRTYDLAVRAYNDIGPGQPAEKTFVVPAAPALPAAASAPSAPGIGRASAGRPGGRSTATARWTAPSSTGGSPLTAYQVLAYRMGHGGTVLKTVTSVEVAAGKTRMRWRLPKGRYRFAVRVQNAAGWSALSETSALVRAR